MIEDSDRDLLVDALALYAELGVDCAVGDEALDWLARGETPPGQAVRQALAAVAGGSGAAGSAASSASAGFTRMPAGGGRAQPVAGGRSAAPSTGGGPPVPAQVSRQAPADAGRALARGDAAKDAGGAGAASARKLAAEAKSLEELGQALERFEGCALKATAKNTCFYRGAARSRLMIIGEAPGRDEDLAGKPFVGRAGKLLDRMLAAIGLGEADVHITNVVYWRPPGNRTPTLQETDACRPFLERQAEFVAPDFVLLVGGAAAKSILDTSDGIMRLRGKWRDLAIGGRAVKALATLHPAYLLRTPAAKRQAWRDLLSLQAALEKH